MIDTHCHLTAAAFAGEVDEVVARSHAAGLTAAILIGTGVDDAEAGAALAARHPGFLHRAAGLDPFTCHQVGVDGFTAELERLDHHLAAGGVCALGECGLEYHHQVLAKTDQADCFEAQLDIARRHRLPVVIHVREAHQDMLAILRNHPTSHGVIHSFQGDAATAEAYLALGWYCSFNGMVTFKKNDELRAACAVVPDDRLLLETDSPYLAPVPMRGKRCEPAFVQHTLALVAEVRGQEPGRVEAQTDANARNLFRLPTTSSS